MSPIEAQRLMLRNKISFRDLARHSALTEAAVRRIVVRANQELPTSLAQVIERISYERQKAETGNQTTSED